MRGTQTELNGAFRGSNSVSILHTALCPPIFLKQVQKLGKFLVLLLMFTMGFIYGSPTCGFSWAGILWPTCSSGHLSPSTSPELVDQGEERGTALDQGLMH